MASPQRTLDLLDELQRLGFDDEAFWRLHHFRLKDCKDTIQEHRDYVEKQSSLRDNDSNEEVQRRLELVLNAYRLGGFKSGRQSVFAALADAAFYEIPPRRSVA
jgi:hypothetical protein